MAHSDTYDADEPVRRSGIGRFISGILLGVLICVLVAIGLTLSFPLPEGLPGVGTVRVEGSGVTGAAGQGADQDQDVAASQSGTEAAVSTGGSDEFVTNSDTQESDALASGEPAPSTSVQEEPADGRQEDVSSGEPAAADQDTASEEVTNATATGSNGSGPELPAVEISLSGPALEVNSRAFEAPVGAPLLAVILTDAGNGTIEPDTLPLLTMPLTLAIEPAGPESATLAAAARTAKHEVLVQLPFARSEAENGAGMLHSGMSADELQDLTLRNLAALPGAIGATPREGAQMLGASEAMQAVIAPLKQHGFAFVDLIAGSGSVVGGLADADGLSYAEASRVVPAASNGEQIFTNLENAAFQARQKGTAIVEITSGPEALTALLRWGLEKDRRPVWFAPVSAVLKRRAEAE